MGPLGRQDQVVEAGAAAGLAALAVWTAACLWYPLTDTDIWWHLAAARWMWEHGAVPRTDPFAISSLGKPWVDLHWGYQLFSHGLWSLGGAAALVAGKVAAVLAAVVLALRPRLRPRLGPASAWILPPLAAYGVFHSRFYLDVRPLAVTLLGLSLLHWATMAHLEGRLRRPWLVLLPVQVALANMQGLYPLGAFLVTCLLIGAWWERRASEGPGRSSLRPLVWTTAGLWLAGLATPYGWAGFLLPLALLARITPLPGNIFSSEIAENQPLFALARLDPRALIPWLIILFIVLWTFLPVPGRRRGGPAASSRRYFPLGHALILAGFAALGCMAQRNLPLFVLAALLAAGNNLRLRAQGNLPVSPSEKEPSGAPSSRVRNPFRAGKNSRDRDGRRQLDPALPWSAPAIPWMAPVLIALLALLYGPRIRGAWAYELPGSLETPFRFPGRAADYLVDHPLPGQLFNELRFGGYLAWRLYPSRLVYVDGRMILRDAAFYRDFLDVVDRPAGFPAYADQHGLTHALLPIGEEGRFRPLAADLLGRQGWDMLYCDGAAVLLARDSLAGALALPVDAFPGDHPALRALRDRFGANPRLEAIALRNFEALLREAGLPRQVSGPDPGRL